MILKLVGSALVMISCIAVSRTVLTAERSKSEQIEAFISLLRYIRHQIDCYSIPMDRIFADCPLDILEPLGGKENDMSFERLLKRKEIILEGEAKHILEEFSETLGKNYRDRQIKLCDIAISSLEGVRGAEQKKYAVKKKTVNALCLAAGGMVVILLI